MIFLRQKPYGQSRPRNVHRLPRNYGNRPVQVTLNRVNSLNDEPNLSHRRRMSSSLSSIDFIRSITLNERLASIGGLFGALSIIITGALLYAIFTAKSQDKWYYVIAVLVNISILVILMIAAILFDRLYLKKYSNRTQSNTNRSRSSRIININPALYNNLASQPGLISNLNVLLNRTDNQTNSLDYLNIRSYNDIPPEYPGYLEPTENNNDTLPINQISTSANESVENSNKARVQISTISSEISNQITTDTTSRHEHSQLSTYLTDPILMSNLNFINPILNEPTQIAPPNYFDLYPSSDGISPSSSKNETSQRANTSIDMKENRDTIIQIEER